MSLVKDFGWTRKSKSARQPLSLSPRQNGESRTLASAAFQPSMPPHSINRWRKWDFRAFVSIWHRGKPTALAVSL